ncbi:hypothetical protein [Paenibacillus senegalensis]|uniref:hypothetical protein n=1 Tax=Paenibacillus senegalensis TaxID=1465766 RepID=UPI0012F770E3|nr:hypothetical protein [Paenibacillus senegalensis]
MRRASFTDGGTSRRWYPRMHIQSWQVMVPEAMKNGRPCCKNGNGAVRRTLSF